MAKMEIEKLEAQTLPYDLRDRIVEECQKNAKPQAASSAVIAVFSLIFIICALNMLPLALSGQGEAISLLVMLIVFLAVPGGLVYTTFIRPKKILKLAQADDYTYYIGRLTDKITHTSSSRHGRRFTYYLCIDDIVQCRCDSHRFSHAKIGEQYAVLYFHKKNPEMCLEVACNENDPYTYDRWDKYPQ